MTSKSNFDCFQAATERVRRIALYVPCFRCLNCGKVTDTEQEIKEHTCG